MKRFSRIAALVISLCLLLASLAGCGGEKDPAAENKQPTETVTPEYVYVADYVPLDESIRGMNNCCWYDGRLYFMADVKTGTESYKDDMTGETYEYDLTESALFSSNEDGSDLKRLENYKTPELTDTAELSGYGIDPASGSDIATYDGVMRATAEVAIEDAAVEETTEETAEETAADTAVTTDEAVSVVVAEPVPMPAPSVDENYIPEDNSYSYVQNMVMDPAGAIWVVEYLSSTTYELPEDYDPTMGNYWDYAVYAEQYFVRKLDLTGAELAVLDVTEIKGESQWFYINNLQVDGSGNLYLVDGDGKLWVVNEKAGVEFSLTSDENWINSLVRLSDGSVGATLYEQTGETSGLVIKTVDTAKKAWGESVPVPGDAYNLLMGNGGYDFYYTSGSNFFGFDLDSGEATKLFNWINCDVDNNNIGTIIPLADGRIVCSTYAYSGMAESCELITLSKVPYSEVKQKTTLTYACLYMDYNLRSQIIAFNKANEEYRIEVQDYSEYNTDDDYSAGLTKLTTEILAGKVPDILSTSQIPMNQFAAGGAFENLWPFIDADTELGGRDGLVTVLLEAMQSDDGQLYQIAPSFYIQTAGGLRDVVGDSRGWTMDDLMAAYQQLPEGADVFYTGMTKNDALSMCMYMSLDGLVNWETGECAFNGPEFVGILEFANMFPETFDWDSYYGKDGGDYVYESDIMRLKNGKQLLSSLYISDFQSIRSYYAVFGDDFSIVGYPTGTGEFGSAFSADSGIAMSSACQHKDGAWEFIRTILLEDYQQNNTWNFPVNKAVFDQRVEQAMTPNYYTDPETGEQVEQSQGSWYIDDTTSVELYAMTQEEVDQVMDIINSTTRMYTYDNQFYDIITDECAAFFAGQKTAQQTADLIQSRISIYVNEQR